jgi:cysteine-rich repeat protein
MEAERSERIPSTKPLREKPEFPDSRSSMNEQLAKLWLPACLVCLLAPLPARAVVVPTAFSTIEGPSNSGAPFNCAASGVAGSMRYQQAYSGSELSAGVITAIRFRLDRDYGMPFGPTTIPGVMIMMSSLDVPPDSLDPSFASNLGADATTVFFGDLTLSSTATGVASRPFDVVVPFSTRFPFDPAGGHNLLLDVTIPNCEWTTQLDAVKKTGDSIARQWVHDSSSTPPPTAQFADSGGLVTDLVILPCGNGALDPGEECDDGNLTNGDCCSSLCQYEPSGSPCRGDGGGCTLDLCDAAGICTHHTLNAGMECRPAVGMCDVSEHCDGISTVCPMDAKQPDGTPCEDGTVCTRIDTCQAGICTGADPLDCNDEKECTQDSCDARVGCVNSGIPRLSCDRPERSALVLTKHPANDRKDELTWRWLSGGTVNLEDLGRPTDTTNYTLCLYSGSNWASVPMPAGQQWRAVATRGYKFANTAGSLEGIRRAFLQSGAPGRAEASVRRRGTGLPRDLTPPLLLPVVVQLVNDTNSVCFETAYDAPEVSRNNTKQFKAESR